MATLIKGASVFVNPRTKKILRKGARVGGLMALQAVNNRRQRRGKRVIFPASKVASTIDQFKSGLSAKTISEIPAFVSNQTVNSASAEFVSDLELTQASIPVSTTTNLSYNWAQFSPNRSFWGAKLFQKATTFARYSIAWLCVEYVPAVGTSVNGTFWVGWTDNLQYLTTPTNIQNTQDIEALPVNGNTTLGTSYKLLIPLSKMCGGGKNLYRDDTNVQSGNYPLYYPGILFFGTTNVSSGVSLVGSLKVSYRIKLEEPQVDKAPKGMILSTAAGGATTLTREGRYTWLPSSTTAGTLIVNTPAVMFAVYNTGATHNTTVTFNGTTLAAGGMGVRTITGTNRNIAIYDVPAGIYAVVFNATPLSRLLLVPATTSEAYTYLADLAL